MRLLLFIISTIFISQIANSQNKLDVIKLKWKQKKYDEVISLGTPFRETLQGKAIPALDYMILSSICVTSTPRSVPCTEIQGILKDYYIGLSNSDYKLMESGFEQICQQNSEPNFAISDKLPLRQYAHPQRISTTTSKFKTYFLISEGLKKNGVFQKINYNEVRNIVETLAVEKDSLQRLNDKLIDTYIKRRIAKNDASKIKKAVSTFGPNSKYWTSENFLVITSKNNKINPKVVCLNMENVLSFFRNTYDLSITEDYITIYLVQDYKNVRNNIQRLYSTKLSFNPLGFSNFYDNSMVGWLYDDAMVGTLKHELIHLLIRSRFNFIPEWFEEGLASLYEESRFDASDNLLGKENWRGILLKETPLNYKLSDLFANKDVNFDTKELKSLKDEYKKEIKQMSYRDQNLSWIYKDHYQELDEVLNIFLSNRVALYKDALSRYFLLYLQDKGKLKKMYQALIQRDRSVINIGHYQTLEFVILTVCEKTSMNDLQGDFSNWLNNL
ncbi:hypothetical protein EV143_10284 [Flavobacterium chryseum]|uniref:hypothetical protein n=1 Tax=Flavobacterium sp. P3160 TaxID=2512113 RepID=UPI00105B3AC7|nr:hypothetical protein [Flavobacterium sp. P3160]TDO82824.1 hypothetical protein EV143_10284 [Flavobacterium sp. P3160]